MTAREKLQLMNLLLWALVLGVGVLALLYFAHRDHLWIGIGCFVIALIVRAKLCEDWAVDIVNRIIE